MSELLEAALDYASRGWHVFPLHGIVRGRCTCGRRDCSSPGKHPLVRSGLHEATTDVEIVRTWWGRWSRANVGLATGDPSGIVVIDVDLPRALASLDRVIHKLPTTLTGLTGGGGVHLIYRRVNAIRCTSSRVPGISVELPGIDVRADGGYIVAPPSLHNSGTRYSWLGPTTPIVAAPAWMKEPPRPPITVPKSLEPTGPDGCTPYGRAALRMELEGLRSAPIGSRNHQLNRSAFSLGQLVAAGHLCEPVVRTSLLDVALSSGLEERESVGTIKSGLGSGKARPR